VTANPGVSTGNASTVKAAQPVRLIAVGDPNAAVCEDGVCVIPDAAGASQQNGATTEA
jgi:hypothetical protein